MTALTKKRWALLGVGACAACCAIPLVGILGLGFGTGSAIAAWHWLQGDLICLLLIVAAVIGVGWVTAIRRRKSRFTSEDSDHSQNTCQSSCVTDHSCCGDETNQADQSVCSLNADQIGARLVRFKKLFKDNLIKVWRENSVVCWTLRSTPVALQESRVLAQLESTCCSELTFDVTQENNHILWRISAPRSNNVLLALFEALPAKVFSPGDRKHLAEQFSIVKCPTFSSKC